MASNGANVEKDEMSLDGSVQSIQMARNSVIMIDVNPSIRIEVNDRDTVVAVEGLNDDSKPVLEGLELKGKDYKTAVSEIVTSLQEKEYITNLKNSILISVAAPNDDMSKEILSGAVETVEGIDKAIDYGLSILSQIVSLDDAAEATAEKYGISEGRVDIINKFVAEHSDYSFDKLVENNIQLLNQLFEYIGLPEGVERIGAVAGVVPSEYEEKLNLSELSCDELISFTSAISDFYDKLSEYYSPGDVAKRIGYEFSIAESSSGTAKSSGLYCREPYKEHRQPRRYHKCRPKHRDRLVNQSDDRKSHKAYRDRDHTCRLTSFLTHTKAHITENIRSKRS